MTLIDTLFAQGKRAFREPREAAADVLALDVPREAIAPALVLIVVISAIVSGIADMVIGNPFSMSHFRTVILLLVIFVGFSAAIWRIGGAMDGKGTFADSLVLAIFFQAIFIPLQVVQIGLMTISPGLASLMAVGIFLFGMWVNINFVAALHAYPTLGKAFGVILLASLAVAFLLLFIGPILGLSVIGEVPADA